MLKIDNLLALVVLDLLLQIIFQLNQSGKFKHEVPFDKHAFIRFVHVGLCDCKIDQKFQSLLKDHREHMTVLLVGFFQKFDLLKTKLYKIF